MNEGIREIILDIANTIASFGAGVKVKKVTSSTFQFITKPALPDKEANDAMELLKKKYPQITQIDRNIATLTVTLSETTLREMIRKIIEDMLKP